MAELVHPMIPSETALRSSDFESSTVSNKMSGYGSSHISKQCEANQSGIVDGHLEHSLVGKYLHKDISDCCSMVANKLKEQFVHCRDSLNGHCGLLEVKRHAHENVHPVSTSPMNRRECCLHSKSDILGGQHTAVDFSRMSSYDSGCECMESFSSLIEESHMSDFQSGEQLHLKNDCGGQSSVQCTTVVHLSNVEPHSEQNIRSHLSSPRSTPSSYEVRAGYSESALEVCRSCSKVHWLSVRRFCDIICQYYSHRVLTGSAMLLEPCQVANNLPEFLLVAFCCKHNSRNLPTDALDMGLYSTVSSLVFKDMVPVRTLNCACIGSKSKGCARSRARFTGESVTPERVADSLNGRNCMRIDRLSPHCKTVPLCFPNVGNFVKASCDHLHARGCPLSPSSCRRQTQPHCKTVGPHKGQYLTEVSHGNRGAIKSGVLLPSSERITGNWDGHKHCYPEQISDSLGDQLDGCPEVKLAQSDRTCTCHGFQDLNSYGLTHIRDSSEMSSGDEDSIMTATDGDNDDNNDDSDSNDDGISCRVKSYGEDWSCENLVVICPADAACAAADAACAAADAACAAADAACAAADATATMAATTDATATTSTAVSTSTIMDSATAAAAAAAIISTSAATTDAIAAAYTAAATTAANAGSAATTTVANMVTAAVASPETATVITAAAVTTTVTAAIDEVTAYTTTTIASSDSSTTATVVSANVAISNSTDTDNIAATAAAAVTTAAAVNDIGDDHGNISNGYGHYDDNYSSRNSDGEFQLTDDSFIYDNANDDSDSDDNSDDDVSECADDDKNGDRDDSILFDDETNHISPVSNNRCPTAVEPISVHSAESSQCIMERSRDLSSQNSTQVRGKVSHGEMEEGKEESAGQVAPSESPRRSSFFIYPDDSSSSSSSECSDNDDNDDDDDTTTDDNESETDDDDSDDDGDDWDMPTATTFSIEADEELAMLCVPGLYMAPSLSDGSSSTSSSPIAPSPTRAFDLQLSSEDGGTSIIPINYDDDDIVFVSTEDALDGADCSVEQEEQEEEEEHMEQRLQRLREVNTRWRQMYPSESSGGGDIEVDGGEEEEPVAAAGFKMVCFASDEHVCCIPILNEDQWLDAYREARIGDWKNMAVDRLRFQRRINGVEGDIGWVLTTQHRDKVFKRTFSS